MSPTLVGAGVGEVVAGQQLNRRSIPHPPDVSDRVTVICAPDCVTENVSPYVSVVAQLLLLTVVGHAKSVEPIVTVFAPPGPLLPTLA